MNAIQSFFQKHGVIPATDAGPSWSRASEESLLQWFARYAAIVRCGWNGDANRDATPAERQACLPVYNEIIAEIHKRAARPDASPDIFAAHLRTTWAIKV